jgi:hypothetical protein
LIQSLKTETKAREWPLALARERRLTPRPPRVLPDDENELSDPGTRSLSHRVCRQGGSAGPTKVWASPRLDRRGARARAAAYAPSPLASQTRQPAKAPSPPRLEKSGPHGSLATGLPPGRHPQGPMPRGIWRRQTELPVLKIPSLWSDCRRAPPSYLVESDYQVQDHGAPISGDVAILGRATTTVARSRTCL